MFFLKLIILMTAYNYCVRKSKNHTVKKKKKTQIVMAFGKSTSMPALPRL